MDYPFALLLAAAVAFLASSSLGADGKDYIDRTPSEQFVWYKIDGKDVRYYVMADGRVYPGTIRNGAHVIWHRAEPMLIAEYPFGGPQTRIPLIEAGKVDFCTELPPQGLKRVTAPKEKR